MAKKAKKGLKTELRKYFQLRKWVPQDSILQLVITSKTNKGCRRYYRDSSLVYLLTPLSVSHLQGSAKGCPQVW